MAIIGAGITLQGLVPQVFAWAWNVTGAVTQANVGELVAQDTAAANSVKRLGDGDAPIGVLATFEDRVIEGIKVGTVNHKGGFQVKFTGALAIGDSVVGSIAPGVVKKAAAANRAVVTEITGADTAVVVFL